MYVCVYIYIYYVCVYVYIYPYFTTNLVPYLLHREVAPSSATAAPHMYVCMYVCIYIYTHRYICICIYICIYMYIYIHILCVCIYIYPYFTTNLVPRLLHREIAPSSAAAAAYAAAGPPVKVPVYQAYAVTELQQSCNRAIKASYTSSRSAC